MTAQTGPSLVCPGCGSPDVSLERPLCGTCGAAVAEEAGGDTTPAPVPDEGGQAEAPPLVAAALDPTGSSTAVSFVNGPGDHAACDAWIARLDRRLQAAEAKLAAIRELCEEAGTRTGGRVIAILDGKDGTEEGAGHG